MKYFKTASHLCKCTVLSTSAREKPRSFHSLFNQMEAMLQIMRRFEWTWVGVVFIDDDYGRDAIQILQSELAQSGLGCLAYAEALPWDHDPAELRRIVTAMRTSTARVVIAYAYGSYIVDLMDEVCVMLRVNLGIHH